MTSPSSRLSRLCVVPSAVCGVLAVIVPTAWSFLFASGSYLGVQEDAVANKAKEQYTTFLTAVIGSMTLVALTEILLFIVVLLGLSLLARYLERAPESTARNWAVHIVAGGVIALVYFGFVADRHPGLFLSSLSRSGLAYPLLALSRYLAPLIGFLALVGYGYAAVRGERKVQIGIAVAVLVAVGIGYGRARFARRYVHKPYRESAPPKKEPEASTRPSILWIGVDSLRPDKIDPASTPVISKLLAESVYFPNTIVTTPRTGPSWASSLTSMSPLTNGVETMFPDGSMGRLSKIALPAHLTARGYRTGVFSDYAGEFFGRVDFGFQQRSVPEVELREISGQLLLSSAPLALAQVGMLYSMGPFERSLLREPLTTIMRGLTSFTEPSILGEDLSAWLAPKKDEKAEKTPPFFALVFYSQPHFPYASNRPYYRDRHVGGSSSSLAFGRDPTNETPITSKEDIDQIDGLYRGALAESDAAIGKLLARLEASGQLEDTIVVLTADHGEGLYECPSCVGHGDNLRGMITLRTPLAIRLPKSFANRAPRVIDTYVSQLDIYPTLLSLIKEPGISIHEGVALLEESGSSTALPPNRTLFAETGEWLWTTPAVPKERIDYPPITGMAQLEHGRIVIHSKFVPVIRSAKHRAAIAAPYKLVYEPNKTGVTYHLYKIDEDPLEQHDLADREKATVERLKKELLLDIFRHTNLMSVRDFIVTRPLPMEE